MFEQSARNAGQRDGAVVGWFVTFSLLEDGRDVGSPPVKWNNSGADEGLKEKGESWGKFFCHLL